MSHLQISLSLERKGSDPSTRAAERGPANLASIAPSARQPFGARVVATMGQRIIDSQRASPLDDLFLVERQERGVNPEPARSLDSRPRRQVGESLERAQEFWPAVGIARIVDAIDADPDVERPQRLGPGQREARKTVLRAGTYVVGIPCVIASSAGPWERAGPTVSALPPNAQVDLSSTWRATPMARATRRAASISTACRWPYRTVSALTAKPASLAIGQGRWPSRARRSRARPCRGFSRT